MYIHNTEFMRGGGNISQGYCKNKKIKKIACFQIIRHAKTQNLVTIKQGEEKNLTIHTALNM